MSKENNIETAVRGALKRGPLQGVRLYTTVRDSTNSRHDEDFPTTYHSTLESLRTRGIVFFKKEGMDYFSGGKWWESGTYSLGVTDDDKLIH